MNFIRLHSVVGFAHAIPFQHDRGFKLFSEIEKFKSYPRCVAHMTRCWI